MSIAQANRRFQFDERRQLFIRERLELLWIFRLDRSLALRLRVGALGCLLGGG
jgi:hypothetical protein